MLKRLVRRVLERIGMGERNEKNEEGAATAEYAVATMAIVDLLSRTLKPPAPLSVPRQIVGRSIEENDREVAAAAIRTNPPAGLIDVESARAWPEKRR